MKAKLLIILLLSMSFLVTAQVDDEYVEIVIPENISQQSYYFFQTCMHLKSCFLINYLIQIKSILENFY